MNATDKQRRFLGWFMAWVVLTGWGTALAREPFSADRSPITLSPVPPVPNYGYYNTHWRRWPEDAPVRKRKKDRDRPTEAEPAPAETAPEAGLESLPDEPPQTTPEGDLVIPPEESLFPPDEPLPPLSPGTAPAPSTPDSLLPPSEPLPSTPPATTPGAAPSAPSDSLFPPEDTPGGLLLPPTTPGETPGASGPMSSRGRRPGSPTVARRAPSETRRTGAASSRGWRPSGAEPTATSEEAADATVTEPAGPALTGPGNSSPATDSSTDPARWRRPARTESAPAPVATEPDRFRPTTPLRPATSRASRIPGGVPPSESSGGIVTAAYTSTSSADPSEASAAATDGGPSGWAPVEAGNPLRDTTDPPGASPVVANPLRSGR